MYYEDGEINTKECALYCRPDQLCESRIVTEIAGGVTKKAAIETGLREGTPVIVGTGDSTAEAVSVGIVCPGNLMFQFGSSLFFYYCTDHEVLDPRVHGGNYTVPGTYSVSGGTNAAGTLTRWVRDNFFFDLLEKQKNGGEDAFGKMCELIPESSDGLICLPYLAGERMPINDPDAKGLLFGLKLSHDRGHIYRAALEGVACSLTQNVQLLENVGLPVDHITAVGGGTKNKAWMQITADISGKRIEVPEITIGASYGDALMAAIAGGKLSGFSAIREVLKGGQIYQPDFEKHTLYQETLRLYSKLYESTAEFMHEL